MEVTNIWNGKDHIVFDDSIGKVIKIDELIQNVDDQEIFMNTIIFNSTDNPLKKEGNPTELATLKYMLKCDVDVLEYREKGEKIFEASFSSNRKRMSTVIKFKGKHYIFTKGASEYML